MLLERIFKIFITISFIVFLVWLWRHQIDPKETLSNLWRKKIAKQTEWIATRDLNAIYQNGKIVGNITGGVDEVDGKVVFHEICNTSQLNRDLPFEYGRVRLKIIRVQNMIGVLSDGFTVKQSVIQNVICEKAN